MGLDQLTQRLEWQEWRRVLTGGYGFGSSVLWFQRNPDINGRDELAGRGFANIDALSRDELARLKIEADPWLPHAAERHFLDGPTGGRVHDRGDNTS